MAGMSIVAVAWSRPWRCLCYCPQAKHNGSFCLFFLLLLDYFRQTLSYTFFCYLLLWLFQNRDWKSYSIKGQIVNTQVLQAKRQNQGYYAAAYMIREKINFHEFFY